MNRREFITTVALSTVVWTVLPLNAKTQLSPINSKVTDPWKATSVDEAITLLYGKDKKIIESDKVKVETPKIAEYAGNVPIRIISDIDAKRVIVLHDTNIVTVNRYVNLYVNPFVIVGIFEVPKYTLIDYSFRIKIAGNITISVLLEDRRGNIYMNKSFINVGIAEGCS